MVVVVVVGVVVFFSIKRTVVTVVIRLLQDGCWYLYIGGILLFVVV